MIRYRKYSLALLLFLSCLLQAQEAPVVSLKLLLRNLPEDSARVNTLNAIADAIYSEDPDEAINYCLEALDLAGKIHYTAGEALALKNIGLGYYMQGEFTEALRYWEPSLALFEELGDEQLVANLLGNMWAAYLT
ncbi:MAG: tetratricopeptide repeat protein [Bacteroidales bacterium]|nr:tetratricopeptide repeat protein [Bacteroidales bacterium]